MTISPILKGFETGPLPWHSLKDPEVRGFYRGDKAMADKIASLIESDPAPDHVIRDVGEYLKNLGYFTSGVMDGNRFTIIWTDHIRSWPLFYNKPDDKTQFVVSPQAVDIKDSCNLKKTDDKSVLEFTMSGYVTGDKTLYEGLYALQPGEFLVFDKKTCYLHNERYYRYIPKPTHTPSWADNCEKLGNILDRLTQDIIQRAHGKTIWIPLSAGLDSRILICKLHEHGYKNIKSFTYGPRFNFEAKYAKKIAEALDIPWQHIVLGKSEVRKMFKSEDRRRFWDWASNLKTVPCMREYTAIAYLHKSGQVKPKDVFLNGQSGDFITGGHIPSICFGENRDEITDRDVFKAIVDKHYDLWKALKIPENLKLIFSSFSEILGSLRITNRKEAAQASELWEYEGRQVCYVINGQRIYEFFGYDWEMPLWDKSLVDFYKSISLEEKKDQELYKVYLRHYNYKNLFPHKDPYIWRWPLSFLWVVPIARLIGLLLGRKYKDKFYNVMKYFGHYNNQYLFYSFKEHVKTVTNARSIITLHTKRFLEERGLYDFTKISS